MTTQAAAQYADAIYRPIHQSKLLEVIMPQSSEWGLRTAMIFHRMIDDSILDRRLTIAIGATYRDLEAIGR